LEFSDLSWQRCFVDQRVVLMILKEEAENFPLEVCEKAISSLSRAILRIPLSRHAPFSMASNSFSILMDLSTFNK